MKSRLKFRKNIFWLLLCFIAMESYGQVLPTDNWWDNEPYRLVQTNLREIDAIDFDVDVYVNSIKKLGANTVLINVGGIVANYYTEVEYHYRNPNLKFDMIKEVTERLHQEGIRVIGRFDFSKLNEIYANQKPEWLYKSESNKIVNYNGQVHTCINGGYQQEVALKILDEAFTRFPLDGVFFNMIGYPMRDYGNNYHGICQCNSCQKRFKEWSGGLELPGEVDNDDPVFLKYAQFKDETKSEQFTRVRELIRSHGNQIAICTYTHAGTDFFRNEANSHLAFYEGKVPWEYKAASNVKIITGSWDGKLASNAAVHFYGYPARHTADARWLTQQRLFQNLMHGAGLDFYCIGRIDNLEDRFVLKNVQDVFQFHKAHEQEFTHVHSGNKILLLRDGRSEIEYRGVFDMLTENHLLFDAMEHWCLGSDDMPRSLSDYELIIMPDISRLSTKQCQLLDQFVEQGGKLLATGLTSTKDELGNPKNHIQIKSFGVEPDYKYFAKEQGTYFRIFEKDKEQLGGGVLNKLDLVYAWEEGMLCKPKAAAVSMLGYIPPAMIGPPEKCYYKEVTTIPGLIYNETGKGKTVLVPFRIGTLYNQVRQYGHGAIIKSAIFNLLGYAQNLELDTGPMVQVSRQIDNAGNFEWYGLLNHTGQLGNAFYEPVDIYNVGLKIKPKKAVSSIVTLKSKKPVSYKNTSDGWIEITVPVLGPYDVILVNY